MFLNKLKTKLIDPGPNTKSDVFVLFRSQEIRSDIIQFSITRFGFFSSESDQKFIENGQKVPNWQKINKVFFSLDFVSEKFAGQNVTVGKLE